MSITIKQFNKKLDKLAKELTDIDNLKELADIQIDERKKGINKSKDYSGSRLKKNKDGRKPFIKSTRFKASKKITSKKSVSIIPTSTKIERIIGYHEVGNPNLPKRTTFKFYKVALKKIEREIADQFLVIMKKIF